ncbi:hypothetical protein Y032_0595g430 [Ancylostoma ceylanicum]|nr:hypothetical protein Y032_0595g430 [Ancylostoma ceylanicum]
MIHLISLSSLIAATLACVPGYGEHLGIMTIHCDVPYTESNRKHYEELVWKAVESIAYRNRAIKKRFKKEYVRVNGRNVNGKLVVDVQAMYIDCQYKFNFEVEFARAMGENHRLDIICPAK